jgi:hypothetical protein
MILRPVRRLKRPPIIGLTQAHEWFRPAVVAGKKRDAPSFLGQGKSWRDGYFDWPPLSGPGFLLRGLFISDTSFMAAWKLRRCAKSTSR